MKKFGLLFLIFLLCFTFSIKRVFAQLYSQPDDSVRVTTNGIQFYPSDDYMTGLSGSNFYVSFPMDFNNSTNIYAFRIVDITEYHNYYAVSPSATSGAECYTTPDMTGDESDTKRTIILDTAVNVVFKEYPCGTTLNFNPSHTYRLIIEKEVGFDNNFGFYGSSSDLEYDLSIYFDTEAPPPPPDTQGTYNELPLNGAVVSTSGTGNVTTSFDYFLDPEQDPENSIEKWCIRLTRTDSSGEQEYCDNAVLDTYTSISHEFTGLPLNSQWEWKIVFTRPNFLINEIQIPHAGSNYFWAGRFTIDSTVQEIYDVYTTCSITEIAGCLQNAIVFLFYPSQSSLNDFTNLYNAIKNKPPFGYISATQTVLKNINDTETSVFTLETMPILDDYIFTPFRTAITWVMWLGFIFIFYHRFKNIDL